MAFGKMDGVAEANHFPQKVRPMAEAFQDTRHLLAAGFNAPLSVDLRYFAGSVRVFDDLDLVLRIVHLSWLTIRFSFVSATQLSIFGPSGLPAVASNEHTSFLQH
jgi:hypothetical protein